MTVNGVGQRTRTSLCLDVLELPLWKSPLTSSKMYSCAKNCSQLWLMTRLGRVTSRLVHFSVQPTRRCPLVTQTPVSKRCCTKATDMMHQNYAKPYNRCSNNRLNAVKLIAHSGRPCQHHLLTQTECMVCPCLYTSLVQKEHQQQQRLWRPALTTPPPSRLV